MFCQETADHQDVVLATFETSARELLFPYPQLRGPYCSGVDVDLLMEPTKDFPGIISPKVSSNLVICWIDNVDIDCLLDWSLHQDQHWRDETPRHGRWTGLSSRGVWLPSPHTQTPTPQASQSGPQYRPAGRQGGLRLEKGWWKYWLGGSHPNPNPNQVH